jgi:deazaflavin-dependent oxidoreductase (nitroreductase family)
MAEYIPSAFPWVAEQVELYETSGGTEGTTFKMLPVIIVTNIGHRTGAIRKTPLMRVVDGNRYVLIASQGGAPQHPLWYHNLKAERNVTIRDGSKLYSMTVREVTDEAEREPLWALASEAYPPYRDYQEKTSRLIPVFLAEPAQ